jgi:hypothetical protein
LLCANGALAGACNQIALDLIGIERKKVCEMDNMVIEVTPELQKMFDIRLVQGRHVDTAEYLRDLVRRDMAAHPVFGVDRNQQTEGL